MALYPLSYVKKEIASMLQQIGPQITDDVEGKDYPNGLGSPQERSNYTQSMIKRVNSATSVSQLVGFINGFNTGDKKQLIALAQSKDTWADQFSGKPIIPLPATTLAPASQTRDEHSVFSGSPASAASTTPSNQSNGVTSNIPTQPDPGRIATKVADSINWHGLFGAYQDESPQVMMDQLWSNYQESAKGDFSGAERQGFRDSINEFVTKLKSKGITVTHPPFAGFDTGKDHDQPVWSPAGTTSTPVPSTNDRDHDQVTWSGSGAATPAANPDSNPDGIGNTPGGSLTVEPPATSPEIAAAIDEANKQLAAAGITATITDPTSVQNVRDQLFLQITAAKNAGGTADYAGALSNWDSALYSKGISFVQNHKIKNPKPPVIAPPVTTVDTATAAAAGAAATPAVTPSASAPASHFFTLMQADGDPAVYMLNNRGERFHVTPNLKNEMIAGGTWYDPPLTTAADLNSHPLRYEVNTLHNVESINNPPIAGNFMLIRGSGGAETDNSKLIGNSNAVYAVDTNGKKFHVTESAYNELVNESGGTPPAVGIVDQSSVDATPVSGALAVNPAGGVQTTTDQIMDQALASAMNVLGGSPSTDSGQAAASAAPAAAAVPDPGSVVYTDGPFAGYTVDQVKTFSAGVNAGGSFSSGDSSGIPAGVPPMPGYTNPQ
ncbi:MAG: hypothetical protein JWO47_1011 [Candidatus Saccharibacteria bacterium]|nr:hypothetical protein [Candidatus Saccharibacteria bacterium]